MSDLKKQLEVDIKRFIDNIENQSDADKIQTLRNMFKTHLHLHTCDYMMDKHDLQTIIGGAKGNFSRDAMPIYLGAKKRIVDQNELPNMMVIESTISYLNKNDCLKKMPKFDKREDKF